MPPQINHLQTLASQFYQVLADRFRERDDRGSITDSVVTIALLVAIAIAALGIIGTKVLAKARGLDLGD